MESCKCNKPDHESMQGSSDQLWEICSWMPAKAVIKFLSLSKTLNSFLSEPSLVERQSIRSSLDGSFFLHPHHSLKGFDKLEFHVLDDDNNNSSLGIPLSSLTFLEYNGRLVASSQGLLLYQCLIPKYGPCTFLIFNPATRTCSVLPLPRMMNLRILSPRWLIECHPRNLKTHSTTANNYFPSNYTITAPMYRNVTGDFICPSYAYSLAVYRNGKWDDDTIDLDIKGGKLRLDMPPVGVFRESDGGLSVYYIWDSWEISKADGKLGKPYIVAYDIEKKNLPRKLKLPENAWKKEDNGARIIKLFKWRLSCGETVGLVREEETMLTVWVLEDYERQEWRMVVTKTTGEMGVPENEGGVVGCSIVNGSGLLFATKTRVYMYEMEGLHAGSLKDIGEHGFLRFARNVVFTLYANTLRPVCCGESKVATLSGFQATARARGDL